MFVADKDSELECDRFDEDIRGKPPDTGRETDCSLDEAMILVLVHARHSHSRPWSVKDGLRVESGSCFQVIPNNDLAGP